MNNMSLIPLVAKSDFIASITQATPINAISELIWNGFDANATEVKVFLDFNNLDGLETIRVYDNGYGIDQSKVKNCFGGIGDSWKKDQKIQNNRALHGKNGKGRLKAFSLGTNVEWNTIYNKNNEFLAYIIKGNYNELQNFKIIENINNDDVSSTGTEVIISNLTANFKSLISSNATVELAKVFAVFLTEYPHLKIEFDGEKVDPLSVQTKKSNYDLSQEISGITDHPISLTIVEWNIDTERTLNLCDANGITLGESTLKQKIKAPGFNFTAYLKSEYIRELDSQNLLTLSEIEPSLTKIIPIAISKIKDHFRARLAEQSSEIVNNWKSENIYPYEEKTSLTPLENVERQVFDILAVNVQTFLPSFADSDKKNRKFTFKLLAQAIAQNPDSVQTIINEVLELRKEEQDQLAQLLSKTPLSHVISSAKTITDRLNFLHGLEDLLFQEHTKKIFLERDQLHKILENEAWIFHEEFTFSLSEKKLEDVLTKHLNHLGERLDPVLLPDGKTGRVDLMLSKTNQLRTNEYDHLIVELKRPTKKIDSDVITQIKKYAMAVVKDERFKGVASKWTFLAVSNDFDDYAYHEANQRDKPKGVVWDSVELNAVVIIKTWAEVIDTAKSKLKFINDKLKYIADFDSSMDYLEETHSKYIPRPKKDDSAA